MKLQIVLMDGATVYFERTPMPCNIEEEVVKEGIMIDNIYYTPYSIKSIIRMSEGD
jgi:hypothetical protein